MGFPHAACCMDGIKLLHPIDRVRYCVLTWLELLVGATEVHCRINLSSLTSPEVRNSQLREMVWTAIKALAIYTHINTCSATADFIVT